MSEIYVGQGNRDSSCTTAVFNATCLYDSEAEAVMMICARLRGNAAHAAAGKEVKTLSFFSPLTPVFASRVHP